MGAEILPLDNASVVRAAAAVRAGGLVIFPTDTVYGLGCDPTDAAAVGRLFQAKGRGERAVPVLCSSESKARELVELGAAGSELARRHWPGALTVVAPLRKTLPPQLSQGGGTLGVRVPAHEGCLSLISACGGWLTGTSANRSGDPPSRTAGEAFVALGGGVDLILDGGPSPGDSSTVVRVDGDTVTILRSGPVGVRHELRRR